MPTQGANAKGRGKKKAAPPREPKPKPPNGSAPKRPNGSAKKPPEGDWSQLADRAARKVKELADAAMPKVKGFADAAMPKVKGFADAAMPKVKGFADAAMPKAKEASESAKKVAVDLGEGLDGAFAKVSEQARDLMAKGQHTRVRIKFRGKQLAELPIAAVAAAEVASFWWLGPLRLVIGHVVGRAVLDVEFVSNADANVAQGRTFLADGELDKAIAEFDKALSMDRRCAGALLGKGIALKLRGDRTSARKWFEDAEAADPRGEAGREARRHLDNL